MNFHSLDPFDFLEVDGLQGDAESPQQAQRGRPPLTVKNPLDQVPPSVYLEDGRPVLWLDDILTGAIRTVGLKDRRTTTRSPYVGISKVVKTLSQLPGDLTPRRVAEALGVTHDVGWRIVSVIQLSAFAIERTLRACSRVRAYCPGLRFDSPPVVFNSPHG